MTETMMPMPALEEVLAAEPVVAMLGNVIAKSRYEAWDLHAHGPEGMTWEQYRDYDPRIALGVYLADGRRDAERLIPLVQYVGNQAATGALKDAAAELLAAGHTAAADQLIRRSKLIDWRSERTEDGS